MLSFTHDSKRANSNNNYYGYEEEYDPIVIHNGTGVQKPLPQPSKSQKKIVKTHSNNQKSSNQRPKSIHRTQRPQLQNAQWNPPQKSQKRGLFDTHMKKDTLAADERRLRAEAKIAQRQNSNSHVEKISRNQKQIFKKQEQLHHKKLSVIGGEKEKEIQRLKKIIEMERAEKEKDDEEYERRKRKIEEERKHLIMLEREIQKNGPKASKELKKQIKVLEPEFYPAKDRPKCYPEQKSLHNQKPQEIEITQSESLVAANAQRTQLRQQQLQNLISHRQSSMKNYQKNTLSYTPALVPLLSKASYKIVSTHVSTLVQLFIDDLLEEQVLVLERIELEERMEREREKERGVMRDFVGRVEEFVEENQSIECRVGRYNQMRFDQIYKYDPREAERNPFHPFIYPSTYNSYLKLDCSSLGGQKMEQISSRVQRYKRFVSSFDEYKPNNLKMFEKCGQEIIDEALLRLAKELDQGSGEFVDLVFRSEFE